MDRFRALHNFVKVVDAGSITAAADKQGTVKSAVSRRLKELEDHLGVRLLNRSTHALSLTEEGTLFYQRATRLLADWAEAEQLTSAKHQVLRGTLRIAAPLSFGVQHLVPLLNRFMAEHEELNIDFGLSDRRVDIIDEGFDLAIRVGKLDDNRLVARRLCPMQRITTASPAYLKRFGTPRTPQELDQHWGLTSSNLPASVYWHYHSGQEHYLAKPKERMRANNGEAVLAAAVAGLGLCAGPTFLAHEALKSGALLPLLTDYSLRQDAIYAVYPSGRHLSFRVRTVIDHLREQLTDTPYWDQALSREG